MGERSPQLRKVPWSGQRAHGPSTPPRNSARLPRWSSQDGWNSSCARDEHRAPSSSCPPWAGCVTRLAGCVTRWAEIVSLAGRKTIARGAQAVATSLAGPDHRVLITRLGRRDNETRDDWSWGKGARAHRRWQPSGDRWPGRERRCRPSTGVASRARAGPAHPVGVRRPARTPCRLRRSSTPTDAGGLPRRRAVSPCCVAVGIQSAAVIVAEVDLVVTALTLMAVGGRRSGSIAVAGAHGTPVRPATLGDVGLRRRCRPAHVRPAPVPGPVPRRQPTGGRADAGVVLMPRRPPLPRTAPPTRVPPPPRVDHGEIAGSRATSPAMSP